MRNAELLILDCRLRISDARPTDQSYAVFKQLSAELDGHLAALEAIVATDLPPLNKLLVARRLAPVGVGAGTD